MKEPSNFINNYQYVMQQKINLYNKQLNKWKKKIKTFQIMFILEYKIQLEIKNMMKNMIQYYVFQ